MKWVYVYHNSTIYDSSYNIWRIEAIQKKSFILTSFSFVESHDISIFPFISFYKFTKEE